MRHKRFRRSRRSRWWWCSTATGACSNPMPYEVPSARTTTEIFCHRDFLFTRMPELIATSKSNGSCAIASPSRWSAAVHTGAFACVQCCLLRASAERRHYLRANVQRRSHTGGQEEPVTIGSKRGSYTTARGNGPTMIIVSHTSTHTHTHTHTHTGVL